VKAVFTIVCLGSGDLADAGPILSPRRSNIGFGEIACDQRSVLYAELKAFDVVVASVTTVDGIKVVSNFTF
jgi:hypothetical protein